MIFGGGLEIFDQKWEKNFLSFASKIRDFFFHFDKEIRAVMAWELN